jgi:hypothetical protein
VTVVVPRGNVEVVIRATPEPFRVAVPKTVVPAVNMTTPVGVVVADVTVAVNVTFWPNRDGFRDEVSVVAVVD